MMIRIASVLVLVFLLPAIGCGQTVSTAAKRKPIFQDTPSLMELPDKVPVKKWDRNTIASLEKDKPAPFSGILFIEPRAIEAGKVRIAYDKLYAIADINRKLTVAVIKVADRQLENADARIQQLVRKQNSWWVRNSLAIGVVGGFVVGVGVTGLIVWGVSKAMK